MGLLKERQGVDQRRQVALQNEILGVLDRLDERGKPAVLTKRHIMHAIEDHRRELGEESVFPGPHETQDALKSLKSLGKIDSMTVFSPTALPVNLWRSEPFLR